MALGLHTTLSWQNRQAIVLSDSASGLDPEVRERFERRSWKVVNVTSSVETAVADLMANKGSFLIIDDTPQMPAGYTLRQLLNHKVAFFTPILILSALKDGKEKACISHMLNCEFLEKPFVPARFIEVFEFAVFKWSNGDLSTIRQAGTFLLKGQTQLCVKELARLATKRELAGLASCCLSLFLRDSRDFKTAERILLAALKNAPKNTGIVLSLVDLYLKAAMPYMAQRLLSSANAAYDNALALGLDTVQTYLMLNDLPSTIPHLKKMIENSFMTDLAQSILARVYLAQGLQDPLKALFEGQVPLLTRFQQAWSRQDNPVMPKAG